MTEFYYGLPQAIWDNLCVEAEDLLQEEQLGIHLVGVYPAGNRIYGLESCPPGLFCLYVDSVEPILDPLSDYHNKSGFKVFSIGESLSPIIVADLYKWVRWVCSRYCDWRTNAFLHAIPFGKHIIHEEDSISTIMEQVHQAMKEVNFTMARSYLSSQINKNLIISPEHWNRTEAILFETNKFSPNTNSDWDEVLECPDVNEYQIELHAKHSCISKTTREKISKAVVDLYRFQM